jgi:hypothetical protein
LDALGVLDVLDALDALDTLDALDALDALVVFEDWAGCVGLEDCRVLIGNR